MTDAPMPLTAHLTELRSRLMACVIAAAIGFLICYGFKHHIVAALQSPLVLFGKRLTVPLQIIAPAEAFLTYLKVSFMAGVFLALPVMLYQLWKFVAPGLLLHERKYTVPFIVGSTSLFYAGGILFYFLLPLIIDFLLSFAGENIKAQLSVGYYVSFCIRLMIAFGVVFQLPMVVIFLTQLELISSQALIKNFRYAVVLTFVTAAILTPPDVISQTFMALPTLLLYGVSILIAKRIEAKRAEREANDPD
ncbi:MAG: twin-arginine translocase subunit TatC [bacterium]|nr:twin-arginine translocase subunit TatC [bacterium]